MAERATRALGPTPMDAAGAEGVHVEDVKGQRAHSQKLPHVLRVPHPLILLHDEPRRVALSCAEATYCHAVICASAKPTLPSFCARGGR